MVKRRCGEPIHTNAVTAIALAATVRYSVRFRTGPVLTVRTETDVRVVRGVELGEMPYEAIYGGVDQGETGLEIEVAVSERIVKVRTGLGRPNTGERNL